MQPGISHRTANTKLSGVDQAQSQELDLEICLVASERPTLSASNILLWQLDLQSSVDIAVTLSFDEQAYVNSLRALHRKEIFQRSRSLLRQILSHYLQIPATEIPIVKTVEGKPIVPASLGVYFNTSHSGDYLIVAITKKGDLGVDVETPQSTRNHDQLVRRFFAEPEVNQYFQLPASLRLEAFYHGWTCKEAILKGVGCGISRMQEFIVDMNPNTPARLVNDPDHAEASPWQLQTWKTATGIPVALAACLQKHA